MVFSALWTSGPVVRPFFTRSSFPRPCRSLLPLRRPLFCSLSHSLTPWVTRTRKDVWHHPLEMTAIRCLQQRRRRRPLLAASFMKREEEWHSVWILLSSSCQRINQYNESIIGGRGYTLSTTATTTTAVNNNWIPHIYIYIRTMYSRVESAGRNVVLVCAVVWSIRWHFCEIVLWERIGFLPLRDLPSASSSFSLPFHFVIGGKKPPAAFRIVCRR